MIVLLALGTPRAFSAETTGEKKEEPAPAAPAASTQLEDLVVTASRVEAATIDIPAPVTVIRREDFAPQTKFAVDALDMVPGVRVNNRPGETLLAGFEIRGLTTNDTSGSNVLVLLDGIPQRRLSFGGPYMGGLPFAAVDRLELVKGPLGSIYGRGALAGALQLFTNPGTPEWHVNATSSYRSDLKSLYGSLQVTGPISGLEGATLSLTADGKTADGWQPRTDSDMQNYYLHLHLPLGPDDTVTATAGWHDGKDNIVGPVPLTPDGKRSPLVSRGANLAIPDHNFMDAQEFRAGLAWEHRFDETLHSNLSLGYWNGQTETFLGRPSDGPAPGATTVNRLTSERDWDEESWIGQLELQKKLDLGSSVKATLTAGGSLEYLTWNNRTRNVRLANTTFTQGIPLNLITRIEPDPSTYVYSAWGTRDTSETDYGGFMRSQFDFGKTLTAFAGVRYDGYRRHQKNQDTGASSTVRESAYSPSAGLLWHAYESPSTVINPYFSYGRGFAPAFRAVGTTEIVKIDPETSESFELGVKSTFAEGRIQAEASVYQLERQDVAALDAITGTYGNFGDWRIRGVEAGLAWQPVDEWKFYTNYSYRQPLVEKDPTAPATVGKDISMVPRNVAKAGVEYRPDKQWTFGVEGAWYGKAYNNLTNTVKVSDYFLLNARASYGWKNYRVTGFATNLLDEEYAADTFTGVVNGSAFEGLRRGFGVKVEVQF